MTKDDLSIIEKELGISLPEVYKNSVSPYPIPAKSVNSDSEFWDDAKALIELNKSLRAGRYGLEPWPEWLFAVGEEDEVSIGIDLRDPLAPTWWIDHGGFRNKGTEITNSQFANWVANYVNERRSDMEGDGYNPDSSPEEYARLLSVNVKRQTLSVGIALAILVIVVLIIGTWLIRRSGL